MRIAKIREEDCVGCAKCLPACPVDAIIGSAKFMHSVLKDECIGCSLCIAPCPMDCIEIIELPNESEELRHKRAVTAKRRYQARTERKLKEEPLKLHYVSQTPEFKAKIQTEIKEAFSRVEQKPKFIPKNISKQNSKLSD